MQGKWWRSALGVAFLAAVVALAAGLALGNDGNAAAQGGGLERAIAAQEANTPGLLALDGVVGTAVGLAENGDAAVFVLTARGGLAGLPVALGDVPVRVAVTGVISALPRGGNGGGPGGGGGGGGDGDTTPIDPTARFPRPVPIGVSTGHPAITAGTIGARLSDGTNVYALSNNHVYANQNQATIGDAVIQPGTYDGGTSPADDIGTLAAFVPIVFNGAANTVDAAIALSSAAALSNATPADGYGAPGSTIVAPSVNLKVQKYGRTTGQTSGRIWLLNASVNVQYGQGVALFTGQIVVRGGGFSAGGDSGSLVVTQGQGNGPVGLLFAGSNSTTIINPIGAVMAQLSALVGAPLSFN